VKGQGFTIRVKELPDLAEGIQKALDLALKETRGISNAQREKHYAHSRDGIGVPF
jgi:hypothetical protein